MRVNSIVALSAAYLLASCGGGGGGGGGSSGGSGNTNPLPVIAAQTFNGTEDNALSGQIVATDVGDTLTFTASTNPAHGTLTGFTAAGAFTYTPNADFSGADTFNVRVTDSANGSATAMMTVNVTNVNDPPVAHDDVLTVSATNALNVLTNDSDPDNDALTVTVTEAPFAGTATVNADRTIALTLPAGFKGVDRFIYRVTDPSGLSAEATALVYVGIPALKIVMLGGAVGTTNTGIFVDDLLQKRLTHEATITAASIDPLKVSAWKNAVAFQTTTANGAELRYVDLANPGTSRLVQAVSGSETLGYQQMNAAGRFVVYEYGNGSPGQKQINVFDANSAGGGVRLSNAVANEPLARLGSFSATGSSYYYIGITATALPWTTTIYRGDLATRVSTPVSVANPNQTYAFIWPSLDDSRYVDIRFNNGGGMGAYVTQTANPAGATLLHEPLANPNVYFPAMMSPDGNYFVFAESTVNFGIAALRVARPSNPGSSVPVGGPAFGTAFTDATEIRPDSQAFLVYALDNSTGNYAIYETTFAAPQTLTPVVPPVGYITRPTYADAGDSVVYWSAAAGHRSVSVSHRATFGQVAALTPPDQEVAYYSSDPSSQVIVYAVYTDPNDVNSPLQLFLMNVDAPQKPLPLGIAGREISTLRVVPR